MGEVLLKYRVMPDGVEVNLDELQTAMKGAMPAFAKLQGCTEHPFAFGMKCLEATIVVEDEDGNNDKIEATLQGIPGVQGLELLDMGRL